MDQDQKQLEEKIDRIYESVEKTRRYMLIVIIITVVTIVLPIFIGALILPAALGGVSSMYGL